MTLLDSVSLSYEEGKRILERRSLNSLKEHGQFLTPPPVARSRAYQLGDIRDQARLL
jgi:hypothetical protein